MSGLSVVLISRNQEWNIARLVESVLKETAHLHATEIMLVDSASQDCTTAIAAQYPIRVLRLRSDQRLSAAAGRYVGFRHTSGEFVLFLDGDMELCAGWLDQALDVMRSKTDVAVVCGLVIDRPITPQKQTFELVPLPGDSDTVAVSHGGGAALYRRSVLEQVGSFNPYLYSDEEPELCLRIRHAGYRVLRLNRPIVLHYSTPGENFSTLLFRRNRNLWLGFGQNIRYFWGGPFLSTYLRERGWVIAPTAYILVGVAAAIFSLVTGQWVWLALWVAGLLLIALVLAVRKHSLKLAVFSLIRRVLILEGTLRGLMLKPYEPGSYPARYDVVR